MKPCGGKSVTFKLSVMIRALLRVAVLLLSLNAKAAELPSCLVGL